MRPEVMESLQPGSQFRRLALLVAAGALVVYARRGSWAGRVAASVGAALAARVLAGHDDLGILMSRRAASRREMLPDDASEDSFPASDPPSFTSTVGAMAR